MTWEEKFAALRRVGGSLDMLSLGKWRVGAPSGFGVAGEGVYSEVVPWDRPTPEEAVNAAWDALMRLPDNWGVLMPRGTPFDYGRWNGDKWVEAKIDYNPDHTHFVRQPPFKSTSNLTQQREDDE